MDARPRNGTAVGEPCGDRRQVSGHGERWQEVVGGQGESMPPGGSNGRMSEGFTLSLYYKGACFKGVSLPENLFKVLSTME